MMQLQLSEQNIIAIKTYNYSGGDSSLTYKYLLSPFAQFCVDYFIPRWVAPNVITLSGLIVTTVCAVLILTYNPNLNSCPNWLCLLSGMCVFAYQTLDNMDGKQARRTLSSSALGMLFDHTCDVINTCVIGIIMSSALNTGWSTKMFIGIVSGYIPFYFQTWEEYHLGYMILPVFNGPSEGLLIAVVICLVSALEGPQFWDTYLVSIHTIYNVMDILANNHVIMYHCSFNSYFMAA